MRRTILMLMVLGMLAGCASPPPGGSISAPPGDTSAAQDAAPRPEGDAAHPAEGAPVSTENPPNAGASGGQESIPFSGDQLYAAAYLGFEEMEDLSYYTQNYLNGQDLPIHYFSPGEYYLIIPRYPDMALALYKNDIQMDQPALVYKDPACEPFLLQCNISDIFSDVTVELTHQGETVSFSPYLSLKDGSVQVGERGLNLTRDGAV